MDWGMGSSALEALVEFLLVWFGFRFILTFGTWSSTVQTHTHTHTHDPFCLPLYLLLSPLSRCFCAGILFDFFFLLTLSYFRLFSISSKPGRSRGNNNSLVPFRYASSAVHYDFFFHFTFFFFFARPAKPSKY
jgi:hypothetical protein